MLFRMKGEKEKFHRLTPHPDMFLYINEWKKSRIIININ